MRRLLLAGLSCLGCTQLNPAFDPWQEGSEGGEGTIDLPSEPVCLYSPRDGLNLELGSPANFGGNTCATGYTNVWMRVVSKEGGAAVLETCTADCLQCSGDAHPLATFPLIVTEHLPDASTCLRVESSALVGLIGDRCVWGALTIYDALFETPYVIATAHSAEPTNFGMKVLNDAIPAPMKAGACNCDAVGQGNDCCYQSVGGPPEFWFYPFGDQQVFPGDTIELSLPNQAGLQHRFEPHQAERIPTCEHDERMTSWAVVAEL